MYLIAKRLQKRYGIEDARLSLYKEIEHLLNGMGSKPYLGGGTPNVIDVSVFGVLRSIHGLDTFHDVMENTDIAPWFERMVKEVGPSCRLLEDSRKEGILEDEK